MDVPLSEQIVALIATVLAVAGGAMVIVGLRTYGLLLTSAYLGFFLGTFGILRFTIGRAIKPRTASADTSDGDDE